MDIQELLDLPITRTKRLREIMEFDVKEEYSLTDLIDVKRYQDIDTDYMDDDERERVIDDVRTQLQMAGVSLRN